MKTVLRPLMRRAMVAPSNRRVLSRYEKPYRRENGVTVCIAGLFRFNYAPAGSPPDIGIAAITASDRMITAGDVEYEPQQQKVAFIHKTALILIAGDYPPHSQAIKNTMARVNRGGAPAPPYQIACVYGAEIQAIQRKMAEDHILAPLGMNTDTFLSQQKDMSDSFANFIAGQLQEFCGADVAALVVGAENNNAQLYTVDARGVVRCFDDVGFAAIGIGALHASSRLMQSGYVNSASLALALASIYDAKKAAEVAPGVGLETDMHLISRDGIFPIWGDLGPTLIALHEEYEDGQNQIITSIIAKLQGKLDEIGKKQSAIPKSAATKENGKEADAKGDSGAAGSGAPRSADDPTKTGV